MNIDKTIKIELSVKNLMFMAFILLTQLANAQDGSTLYGTWTFSDGPSFSKMSPEMKQHTDTIPGLKAEILSAYSGRRLSFFPNGDFEQTMSSGEKLLGKWNLLGNVLEIADPQGNIHRLLIGEIKSNRLVLIQPSSNGSSPILPELHFIKN